MNDTETCAFCGGAAGCYHWGTRRFVGYPAGILLPVCAGCCDAIRVRVLAAQAPAPEPPETPQEAAGNTTAAVGSRLQRALCVGIKVAEVSLPVAHSQEARR